MSEKVNGVKLSLLGPESGQVLRQVAPPTRVDENAEIPPKEKQSLSSYSAFITQGCPPEIFNYLPRAIEWMRCQSREGGREGG